MWILARLDAVGSLEAAVRHSRAVVSACQRAGRDSFNSREDVGGLMRTEVLKDIRASALFARPSGWLARSGLEKASLRLAI